MNKCQGVKAWPDDGTEKMCEGEIVRTVLPSDQTKSNLKSISYWSAEAAARVHRFPFLNYEKAVIISDLSSQYVVQ